MKSLTTDFLSKVILMGILLLCTSCILENKEYSRRVHFPKEGGTRVLSDLPMGSGDIKISDYDDTKSVFAGPRDVLYGEGATLTLDWLTVDYVNPDRTMTLTVEPMSQSKGRRKLFVTVNVTNWYYTITVVQN